MVVFYFLIAKVESLTLQPLIEIKSGNAFNVKQNFG
jgi:hypothetical protein